MDLGWAAVLQAVIISISTWYVRRGSRQDAVYVAKSTAAQSTSNDILERVKKLEDDLALVKRITLKDNRIDDRGPRPTKGS
jgi:hypothetical protein